MSRLFISPDFSSPRTFRLTRLFISPDFSSHQTFHLTRLFVSPDFLSHRTFCLTGLFVSLDFLSHWTFCLTGLFVSLDFSLRTTGYTPRLALMGMMMAAAAAMASSKQTAGTLHQITLWGVCHCICSGLVSWVDPSQVTYNKTGMRAHLLSCFEDGKMKQFPSVKKHGRQPHVMKLQLS